jgi:hypothetical protein
VNTAPQLSLFPCVEVARRRLSAAERNRERIRKAGKRCAGKCGRFRPWHDFHRRKAMKDGHQSWCKFCSSADDAVRRGTTRIVEKSCRCCLGLSHRRPPRGCARCGEPFIALEVEIAERQQQIRSGFGQGRGFEYPDCEV